MNKQLGKAVQLLSIVIPQLAGLEGVVTILRSAFTRIGGSDAELDAALAENQKKIDKLGRPDDYRHKPSTLD